MIRIKTINIKEEYSLYNTIRKDKPCWREEFNQKDLHINYTTFFNNWTLDRTSIENNNRWDNMKAL